MGKIQTAVEGRNPKRSRKGTRPYRQFSVGQKIAAVAAALTANPDHPTSKNAVQAAIAALGETIHHATLDEWTKLYRPIVERSLVARPVEETILATRDATLSNMFKARDIAIKQLLDEDKAKNANYRDNGVVAGIMHDKIESAIGLSPSMVATVQAWERICNALGLPAEELIKANTEKLQALQQARLNQTTLSTGVE